MPETASIAVGSVNATFAPVPDVMVCVISVGTFEKTGGTVSCTVTGLAAVLAEPPGLLSLAVSTRECCPSASTTCALNCVAIVVAD